MPSQQEQELLQALQSFPKGATDEMLLNSLPNWNQTDLMTHMNNLSQQVTLKLKLIN